jgi:glycosyltransferase involved in cell wall biosynthesis
MRARAERVDDVGRLAPRSMAVGRRCRHGRRRRVRSTLVSVLVPVRDAEAYLEEALRSLAEQTHEDVEVIVVDDGSRDASGEIAREWAARDGRFRLVQQEPRGFVAASQRACLDARGRYVAAMGADDVARPRRLEVQLAVLEEEGLDACGGGVAYLPAATEGLRRYERWLNSLAGRGGAAGSVRRVSDRPSDVVRARRRRCVPPRRLAGGL